MDPTHALRNVQLFKTETLGTGSYGVVYKATCNQRPCAAKLLHPMFFLSNDPGAITTRTRFEKECRFLSEMKHPHVVDYLGITHDPDSGLLVLLMELMDESLTHFLERSQQPLAYHIEVDLCHDIAQALAYIHSNGIIHRDLSSNNILLLAGKAKVTDFGMSKLVDANPRVTPLTMCPGTLVYMPPEALLSQPVYSNKIDCFSFGVLEIQIMTCQFPNPGPAMQDVEDSRSPVGTIHIPVPDSERRKSHIDLIDPAHALLPTALTCLSYADRNRPSAQDLCQQLATFKETPRYTQSIGVQELKPNKLVKPNPLQNQTIRNLSWKQSKSPERMRRGSVAVDASMVYCNGSHSTKVHTYDVQKEVWGRVANCSYTDSFLVVVQGLLTTVGGRSHGGPTNCLLSLMGGGRDEKWSPIYPAMITKRRNTAAVYDGCSLIVAGGYDGDNELATVEVLDTNTRQWSTASSLLHPYDLATLGICGDQLYMLGGHDQHGYQGTRSVLTCSVPKLLQSCQTQSLAGKLQTLSLKKRVWRHVADAPHYKSTCSVFCGRLIAVGGRDEAHKDSTTISAYDEQTDSWKAMAHMHTARHVALVATVPGKVMVIGGRVGGLTKLDTVEVGFALRD